MKTPYNELADTLDSVFGPRTAISLFMDTIGLIIKVEPDPERATRQAKTLYRTLARQALKQMEKTPAGTASAGLQPVEAREAHPHASQEATA